MNKESTRDVCGVACIDRVFMAQVGLRSGKSMSSPTLETLASFLLRPKHDTGLYVHVRPKQTIQSLGLVGPVELGFFFFFYQLFKPSTNYLDKLSLNYKIFLIRFGLGQALGFVHLIQQWSKYFKIGPRLYKAGLARIGPRIYRPINTPSRAWQWQQYCLSAGENLTLASLSIQLQQQVAGRVVNLLKH